MMQLFPINNALLFKFKTWFGWRLHTASWCWLGKPKQKIEEHNGSESWLFGQYLSYYFEKKQLRDKNISLTQETKKVVSGIQYNY